MSEEHRRVSKYRGIYRGPGYRVHKILDGRMVFSTHVYYPPPQVSV